MKTKFLFNLFIVLIILGCNHVDTDKLRVIEKVQLGTSVNEYYAQIENSHIEKMSFYTKYIFSSRYESNLHKISNAPITKIFNFEKYRNLPIHQEHIGILQHVFEEGTDNVIIGHITESATIIEENGSVILAKENGYKTFNQNICGGMISEIKRIIESKYGNPILSDYESPYNRFPVIEGSDIKYYIGDENLKGRISTWETEYLEITLFEGFPSINTKYSTNENRYTYVVFSSGNIDFDIDETP